MIGAAAFGRMWLPRVRMRDAPMDRAAVILPDLTEEIRDLLAAQVYQQRYTAAQSQRLTELAAIADVVIH